MPGTALDPEAFVPFSHPLRAAEMSPPSTVLRSNPPTNARSACLHSLPERADTMVPQPGLLRRLQCAPRRGQCPGLVRLDENSIATALRRCRGYARGVGHQEIIADHLDSPAQRGRELTHPLGIVLRHRILDRQDGIALDPGLKDPEPAGRIVLDIFEEASR